MVGVRLEQDQERGLGSCSKPNPDNDGNGETANPEGYESLLDYYKRVAPQLNEPLYARTA